MPVDPPVPTPPPEAAAADATGASAYARWWWGELIPYTYESGDVGPFRATAGSDCLLCASLAAEIDKNTGLGLQYTGAEVTVTSAESSGLNPNGIAPVTVFLTETASRLQESSGSVVEEYSAKEEERSDVFLLWEDNAWSVADASLGDPFASSAEPSSP